MHPHSSLDFLLQAPTHQKRTKYFRKRHIKMIGSPLQSQEGKMAFGRNRILQALHQTSRSPPRIVQRFLISKNNGSLARSKDNSKKCFSIGWVCMIHCLMLREFLARTVRLKSQPGMNGICWRIVRHFQGHRNMYMVSPCVWRVANVARL